MAFFQVLYWQDIPSQFKVWDDAEELRIELGPEFMARIDQAAQSKGLTSTDDYLAHWNWSDEREREGSAEEVADALKKEFESKLAR
jgi:Virulence factor